MAGLQGAGGLTRHHTGRARTGTGTHGGGRGRPASFIPREPLIPTRGRGAGGASKARPATHATFAGEFSGSLAGGNSAPRGGKPAAPQHPDAAPRRGGELRGPRSAGSGRHSVCGVREPTAGEPPALRGRSRGSGSAPRTCALSVTRPPVFPRGPSSPLSPSECFH